MNDEPSAAELKSAEPQAYPGSRRHQGDGDAAADVAIRKRTEKLRAMRLAKEAPIVKPTGTGGQKQAKAKAAKKADLK